MRFPIRRVDNPWGYELIFAHTDRYVGKILHVKAGEALSLQYWKTAMAACRAAAAFLIAAVLSLGAAGCRGTPQPVVRADETPPAKTASEAPPQPEPSPTAPTPEKKPIRDDDPVIVDPGVPDDYRPTTLAEASRAERTRRASAGASKVAINDKNLHKHASKGQVTIADPKEKGLQEAAAAPLPVDSRDEQYWRSRARDIRERWRQAADDVKELEQKSTELRQKFYLQSDTFTRDNQIKPEWDRVLDKLRKSRLDAETAQKELGEFLEEGRVADVMPGWLREGEDEEPGPSPRRRNDTPLGEPVQSIEPPVVEPPAAEPPPSGEGIGEERS